jgi:mono/diheme cytochrome c family protein
MPAMPRTLITIFVLLAPALLRAADVPGDAEPEVALTFETDVRPILKAQCWQCHGEEEELEGSLDARLARFLLAGGDSGPAVVPGKHAESLIYERISTGEMPPGEKKLSLAEMETIAQWIDAGAHTARPEPETLAAGDIFTEEDRAHWSFQPIRRPEAPQVANAFAVTTPVDAFLLARLEAQSLSFGPAADRATLVRRVSFDLTGLPPTPEVVERFVNDPASDAYERLVDDLLASPAYGERWGRHWLDVAGYADSDGYGAKDVERPWAYKYRDYVIRSFNRDKPWDEFLVEQLAGDELVAPPYANLSPQDADRLIATGFLRMAPDGTTDPQVDQNVARNDVMADTIKIVSTAVLGLTVGCAQCHAHRYDPITHEDYHRIRALFEPSYDWKKWRPAGARLVSLWSDEVKARAAAVDAELKEIADARTAELDQLVADTFERELGKLPEEIQPQARATRETPADKHTDEQKQLIKEYPFLKVDRGSVYLYLEDRLRGFNKKWDELTEAKRKERPADDNVACLTEVPGHVPPTMLFARGDLNSPRDEIAPGELAVLNRDAFVVPTDDPNLPTTGRRLAYANHLTNGKHPLVARVLVNRLWLHHFGRGLVNTPGDFGMLGEPPSHPELLDWLADEFVRGGWKLKPLHRLIVTSTAYRQSSARREELEAIDPDNRLLGRMHVRRLEAETIRDSLLAASGNLSPKMHGTPVPVMPDEVGQIVVGVDTRDSAGRPSGKVVPLGEEAVRRSVYVQVRRSMPLGMLEPFDVPTMAPNCDQRASSTVAPQSLLMMNSALVVEQTGEMAARIRREAGDDPAAQFRRAWLIAFGREATAGECDAGLAFLAEQTAAASADLPEDKDGTPDPNQPTVSPEQTALEHLCHALVISNGFLYVD